MEMTESKYIIYKDKTLLEALAQINRLAPDPLVLFVVDEERRMVGTLTDGDSRRALIAGVSVNDTIDHVMHRNFNSLTEGVDYDVRHLHEQKEKKMRLVPILDRERHIIEIINLERYKSWLPVDAVLMADTVNTCKTENNNHDTQESANQLTVYGAIIANKLEANRTYGAATGVNSMIPAEIIDFDTTLYLWKGLNEGGEGTDGSNDTVSDNSVNTVYVRELAPRY